MKDGVRFYLISAGENVVAHASAKLLKQATMLTHFSVANSHNKELGIKVLLGLLKKLRKDGCEKLQLACHANHLDFLRQAGFIMVEEPPHHGDKPIYIMENPNLGYFLDTLAQKQLQGQGTGLPLLLGSDIDTYYFHDEKHYLNLHQRMLAQARKRIWIISDTINNPLLLDPSTGTAILRLIKRNPQSEVRLLVANDKQGAGYYNPTIQMAQKLSSYVEVRTLQKTNVRLSEMITLVDFGGNIFRKNLSDYTGFANFNSRLISQRLCDNFEQQWQYARPSVELRRLAI